MIGIILVPAGLADKFGLRNPAAGVNVATRGTFLRGLGRVDPDTEFTGLDGLVFGENDRFSPGRGENLLVDPTMALRRLAGDERKALILNEDLIDQWFSGATPGTLLNLVNEPGLYSLILHSPAFCAIWPAVA